MTNTWVKLSDFKDRIWVRNPKLLRGNFHTTGGIFKTLAKVDGSPIPKMTRWRLRGWTWREFYQVRWLDEVSKSATDGWSSHLDIVFQLQELKSFRVDEQSHYIDWTKFLALVHATPKKVPLEAAYEAALCLSLHQGGNWAFKQVGMMELHQTRARMN